MSYIAMAAPIGPWIAPTLVLMALPFFRVVFGADVGRIRQSTVLVAAAGSVGGIVATGCAFSFPSIYFLDPGLFSAWMADRWLFIVRLTLFVACSGTFGIFLANLFEDVLRERDDLPFPIALLISKMINAAGHLQKTLELIIGFMSTIVICVLQDGMFWLGGVIPKTIIVMRSCTLFGLSIPVLAFDIWPMLWSIGFIAGHMIAVPLAVGAVVRVGIVDLINAWFFPTIPSTEFVFAFCSGMVLLGAAEAMLRLVGMVRRLYKRMHDAQTHTHIGVPLSQLVRAVCSVEQCLLLVATTILLVIIGLSYMQIAYLLLATAVFSYQMIIIAGKWGMAPLGRFATFVMLPAMLIFTLDVRSTVFIALFVEICGGVAYDVLCGRVIARMCHISVRRVKWYQYLGICVSVLSVGLLFWLLIDACALGSKELFAYKAQSRSMLINVLRNGRGFNGYVLAFGGLIGYALSRWALNPLLVLGGILMPINISLGLVFGGFLARLVKDRHEWEPLWSGVFAANSVWMLLRTLI